MVRINKMNMRLPAHLHHRAPGIGRQVGELLGHSLQGQSLHMDRMQLKGLHIGAQDSDHEIASAIVAGILKQAGERK
jgi:hypothetical protein